VNATHLKDDLVAGTVVFLVALPLCLGIALASDVPLFGGVIAGIVGGLLVTAISRSRLGVSGPAAGLAVIVADAVGRLGYEAFLVAVVIAGIAQIAAGFLRLGIIGHYFPSAVIKGMLAGIGIILILKQLPHAFGYDVSWMGEMEFLQEDGHNTFSELYYMLTSIGARSGDRLRGFPGHHALLGDGLAEATQDPCLAARAAAGGGGGDAAERGVRSCGTQPRARG